MKIRTFLGLKPRSRNTGVLKLSLHLEAKAPLYRPIAVRIYTCECACTFVSYDIYIPRACMLTTLRKFGVFQSTWECISYGFIFLAYEL